MSEERACSILKISVVFSSIILSENDDLLFPEKKNTIFLKSFASVFRVKCQRFLILIAKTEILRTSVAKVLPIAVTNKLFYNF